MERIVAMRQVDSIKPGMLLIRLPVADFGLKS